MLVFKLRAWFPTVSVSQLLGKPVDNSDSEQKRKFRATLLFVYFLKFYLFLAALGLCCCARAFSSCGEWGLLFVAVRVLLIAAASLVEEHGP